MNLKAYSNFRLNCFILLFLTLHFSLNAAEIEYLIPVIINKIPHERPAFTQGLCIENDQLYESTGLYGQSTLRQINLLTGKVKKKIYLPPHVFAEGLIAFSDHLLHITWKEQKAFLYDGISSKVIKTFPYEGEGWGLCLDKKSIWMSNGTSTLIQYDLDHFTILKRLSVTWYGKPINFLNDLESVGNDLYANIWHANKVIRIDKSTGKVTGVIDCSFLLSMQEKSDLKSEEVLNGIAFRSKTRTFLLTGKEWPWIFEVCLMPQNR